MQTRSPDSVRPPSGPKFSLRDLRHLAETFAIASAGAALFYLANIPAAFLAGAMVSVAVAAIAGRPCGVPRPLARACFVIVGLSLGSVVNPASLRGIAAWPISIAAVVAASACVTVATTYYLRKVHGWETMTAMFAAVPGALSQVLAHAVEEKCDVRGIAVVQSLRVVILTVGVPVALAALGHGGPTRLAAPPSSLLAAPAELAVLVAAALGVGLLLMRIGFPGGLLIGPMTVSAVLHGTGLITVTLPAWATIGGMIGLGAISGSRFTNTSTGLLLTYLGAGLGAFGVAVAVTAAFVLALVPTLHLPLGDLTVAFSPGAIDAMMVLSLALHIDPVFVGAHHIARFFAVSLTLPVVIRYVRRLRKDGGDDSIVK
ncbi:AbrB family transcriptional regulator [Rhodoplanes sp. SY1]|uniref:AbrB family transcriptional regulator n=1 Tax=Rhodoplanes sp. SY1 TaxID=3166646 RepID=UPI0038B6A5F8